MPKTNVIINDDCVRWLNRRRKPFADLIFADPPFNIGYKYDVYEDRKAYDDYKAWTEQWMAACCRVLNPAGSFWIAIGDDYAAEVRLIGRDLGLYLRNWVIWHYTFGQNAKRKFARAHTHLLYFVRDPARFTFNDRAVRTFSDRQRIYKDRRANREGKIPDDVWTDFSRVCGTFGEREGWHPCQMPVQLLARIIRISSNVGDVVLDPLAGSGTTLVAAKRLSRRYVGIELSGRYADEIARRLAAARPVAGAGAATNGAWPKEHVEELQAMYLEAGVSTHTLHASPHLLEGFVRHLNGRLAEAGETSPYGPRQVWVQLERLRKKAQLPKTRVHADEPPGGRVRPLPPGEKKGSGTFFSSGFPS
jgi:site-specific DNA-methyltransferase (adenine-specific)